ncbi:acetyl-CoA carboxylase biotin carboxyl carrier protein subunit, partial [Streptomyces harbinensis]|uniref:acetyl-CoA carboxylase biotin carboxyl carrier protein subunit n=1 Tax=Streptomyces harbinensis TaxID=1176198 RepID=UPI0034DECE8D
AWTAYPLRVPGREAVTVWARPGEVRIGDGDPVPARLLTGGGSGGGPGSGDGGGGGGYTYHFAWAPEPPDGLWLGRDGDTWQLRAHDALAGAGGAAAEAGTDTLTAPMPGTVTVVKAAVGDEVTAGQSLLVVEAMKMEHLITAPHAGTVTTLDVTPGTTVAMDQVLAQVAAHQDEEAV